MVANQCIHAASVYAHTHTHHRHTTRMHAHTPHACAHTPDTHTTHMHAHTPHACARIQTQTHTLVPYHINYKRHSCLLYIPLTIDTQQYTTTAQTAHGLTAEPPRPAGHSRSGEEIVARQSLTSYYAFSTPRGWLVYCGDLGLLARTKATVKE